MSSRAYDPELLEMIPLLPTTMDWSDMAAARQGMLEMLAGASLDPELAGRLAIEDRSIPGPEGAPEVGGQE